MTCCSGDVWGNVLKACASSPLHNHVCRADTGEADRWYPDSLHQGCVVLGASVFRELALIVALPSVKTVNNHTFKRWQFYTSEMIKWQYLCLTITITLTIFVFFLPCLANTWTQPSDISSRINIVYHSSPSPSLNLSMIACKNRVLSPKMIS